MRGLKGGVWKAGVVESDMPGSSQNKEGLKVK